MKTIQYNNQDIEAYKLQNGGYVVDTPGFSSLEIEANDYRFKELLPTLFPDFEEYLNSCKFTTCTHTKELGCGVIEAVKQGKIEKTRFESYLQLFDELKDLKPWEASKNKKR